MPAKDDARIFRGQARSYSLNAASSGELHQKRLKTAVNYFRISANSTHQVRRAKCVRNLAQIAIAHMTGPMGEPNLSELFVHLLAGNNILTRTCNPHRHFDEERASVIETVAI